MDWRDLSVDAEPSTINRRHQPKSWVFGSRLPVVQAAQCLHPRGIDGCPRHHDGSSIHVWGGSGVTSGREPEVKPISKEKLHVLQLAFFHWFLPIVISMSFVRRTVRDVPASLPKQETWTNLLTTFSFYSRFSLWSKHRENGDSSFDSRKLTQDSVIRFPRSYIETYNTEIYSAWSEVRALLAKDFPFPTKKGQNSLVFMFFFVAGV